MFSCKKGINWPSLGIRGFSMVCLIFWQFTMMSDMEENCHLFFIDSILAVIETHLEKGA